MPAVSILIKPESSNCNIDCEYCFYKCLSSNREQYSKGFMSEETLEQLVQNAFDYADEYVSFAFQGGEPTLAGLPFFKKAVALQKKYNDRNLQVENTIQTNGFCIDEEWAEFLGKNHFLVGLSLDGPKKIHDRYRKDILGQATFERVMKTIQLFHQYGVDYNVVSVITEQSAGKASYLYNFYQRNGFPFVQFIPCMDEPERFGSGQSPYGVRPESYGRFLCDFFDCWYPDFMNGNNMDVRMFSNLAQMAAGYPAEECGMSGCCTCYFVVEGDGSIYPCDFYCIDQWKLGTVWQPFKEMVVSKKAEDFVKMSLNQHEDCRQCPYLSLCHGGCRRWREQPGSKEVGMNYLCPAYKVFFAHTKERIQKLGQLILQKYGPADLGAAKVNKQ